MATTMNDLYGDGSPHDGCEVCGFCIDCKDCSSFGCGSTIDYSRKEQLIVIKINHGREDEDQKG